MNDGDEMAIRQRVGRFADAANRVDGDAFARLWAEDAVWTIGPPVDARFDGRHAITEAFLGLLRTRWEFFVQLPSAIVVDIDGDEAKARCYVNEIARAQDGTGNFNLAVYRDHLVRSGPGWVFQRRDYDVLYLDQSPLQGAAFQRAVFPLQNEGEE